METLPNPRSSTVRNRPDATTLRTYTELHRYIRAFADGHLNLIILLGRHGLAKSRTVWELLGDEACWIEGNATAFGIYTKLYRHRDQLVVIDDVDSLYSSRNSVRLLKCLCQTEDDKRLAWHSAATGLKREAIPREFSTKSRVIIIANDWRILNRNVEAVQDRGHVISFEPTPEEVHAQVVTWFGDTEILSWFAGNLPLFDHLSMRDYVRAAELKQAGLDWVQVSLPKLPERTLLVAQLKDDDTFELEENRAQTFVELGAGCRATYFNHARRLKTFQRNADNSRAEKQSKANGKRLDR